MVFPPINVEELAGHVSEAAGAFPWVEKGHLGQISTVTSLTQLGAAMVALLIIERRILVVERNQYREARDRTESKIKDNELAIINKKIRLYAELESLGRGTITIERLPKVKESLAALAIKLERVEKLEIELGAKRSRIRGGTITGAAMRLWLRKELKALDEQEYQVYLQKEHILKILTAVDRRLLHWAGQMKDRETRFCLRRIVRVLNKLLRLEVREGRLVRAEERFE